MRRYGSHDQCSVAWAVMFEEKKGRKERWAQAYPDFNLQFAA